MSIVLWRKNELQSTSSKPTIGERIRRGEQLAGEAWQQVIIASNLYREALDLNEEDLATMEHLDAYVIVKLLDHRQVNLIAKHTCGAPYGGTWVTLMQPRLQGIQMSGIGGGTTFITALSEEDHRLVLEAIARGDTKIAKGHIWP